MSVTLFIKYITVVVPSFLLSFVMLIEPISKLDFIFSDTCFVIPAPDYDTRGQAPAACPDKSGESSLLIYLSSPLSRGQVWMPAYYMRA
jgi:hypothetical protein